MTLGLRDNTLTNYYSECIEKAKAYLSAKFPLKELATGDDEVSSLISSFTEEYSDSRFWQVPVEGSWGKYVITLIIPKTFPDGFPRLYLSKEDYEKYGLLPHVDHNRFICTRDPSTVVINDELPGEAVELLLKIAVEEIIEPGIARENIGDLIDEFRAYWEENHQMSVLIVPNLLDNMPGFLECFRLSHPVIRSQYFISSSAEEVEKWVMPYGARLDSSMGNVIYLPLRNKVPAEVFLARKGVVLMILGNLPPTYANLVERFFNKDRDVYYVLCSFPLESGKVFFGWQHKKWKDIKGFRKNNVPLKMRLLYTRDKDIEKIRIVRVDKDRILKRAGMEGDFLKTNTSLAIIGCGSIGGFLSMSLARCGISKFLLIDNQSIDLENIGRHLCGFTNIGMLKVEAVKKALHDQLPGIECNVQSAEVLTLFLKHGGALIQDYDLLVVATADQAVERRISYLMKSKAIGCPVALLWLEPFGVAGHLLYLSPQSDGCYQCCLDEDGSFLYSAASANQNLSRRESGCQTAYSPIASIDTEQFVGLATKKILELVRNPGNSTLYTWLGDIESFRAKGYKLNDIYVADFSGSLLVKTPIAKKTCPVCKEFST